MTPKLSPWPPIQRSLRAYYVLGSMLGAFNEKMTKAIFLPQGKSQSVQGVYA